MLPCSLPWEGLETGSLQSMRTGDTSWSSTEILLYYFHLKTLKYSNFLCALSSDSEKLDHQTLHHLIQSLKLMEITFSCFGTVLSTSDWCHQSFAEQTKQEIL